MPAAPDYGRKVNENSKLQTPALACTCAAHYLY